MSRISRTRAARSSVDPPDQAAIPHPADRLLRRDRRADGLRAACAAWPTARPDWQLVLIGPTAKIDPGGAAASAANIHYLGPKAYAELPSYIAGWDVAMLPFARNESTRFISPTKTPEYLAAGKPVVSTSIRDVVRPYGEQGLVRIADDAPSFVAAIEDALREDPTETPPAADAFLTHMSWDGTWLRMQQVIEQAAARRPADRRRTALVPPAVDRNRSCHASEVNARVRLSGRRRRFRGMRARRAAGGGLGKRCCSSTSGRTSAATPTTITTNTACWSTTTARTSSTPIARGLRLSVALHRVAPVPASRAGVGRRPAGADPDQPRHHQRAVRHALRRRSSSASSTSRWREPRAELKTSEDVIVSQVGRELYEKFFRNYTRKQWGLDPSELDAAVTARVPTRTNRDDRYFTDTYQAMPLHGYTRMFERMLRIPNIKIMLNTDYREIEGSVLYDEVIYTGPIDEYFDYRFGRLPYRSLRFQFETLNVAAGAAGRRHQLPERQPVHAGDRVQAPDRPGASEDDARLRIPAGGRRSVLSDSARRERGALQAVQGWPTRRRACTSSAGSAPTGTTTWTRWWRRRSRPFRKIAGVRRAECVGA